MRTPEGVEIRGKSIRISFTYREMRCRETLKGWELTKGNLKKASLLRASILSDIAAGTFNYLERFPTSKKAKLFATPAQKGKNTTVTEQFEHFRKLKQSSMSSQSLYILQYMSKQCVDLLGPNKPIGDITHVDALAFQQWLITEPTRKGTKRSPKTVNNMVKVARRCWDLAVKSGYIESNPFSGIELLSNNIDGPDPLEHEEFNALIGSTSNEQQKNMFSVAVYTGMRTGELCALAWEDVDLEKGIIRINRNVTIERKFTTPKNRKSARTIHLLQPAIDALKRQRRLTYITTKKDIIVEVKGSHVDRNESVRFVFVPESSNKTESLTYKTTTYNRLWTRALKRAGIRHRCSYQSRHTYACWLISREANLSFIAEQMGHTGTGMLERVYGRFMDSYSNQQIDMLNNTFAQTK